MIQQITSNPCASVSKTDKSLSGSNIMTNISQLPSPTMSPKKRSFSSVEELESPLKKRQFSKGIQDALRPFLVAYPRQYIHHLPDGTIWRDSVTGAAVDIDAHNHRVQKLEEAIERDFKRPRLPYFVPSKPDELEVPCSVSELKSFKQWASNVEDDDVSDLDLDEGYGSEMDEFLDSLFEEQDDSEDESDEDEDDELVAEIAKIAQQNEIDDDFKNTFDPQGF